MSLVIDAMGVTSVALRSKITSPLLPSMTSADAERISGLLDLVATLPPVSFAWVTDPSRNATIALAKTAVLRRIDQILPGNQFQLVAMVSRSAPLCTRRVRWGKT